MEAARLRRSKDARWLAARPMAWSKTRCGADSSRRRVLLVQGRSGEGEREGEATDRHQKDEHHGAAAGGTADRDKCLVVMIEDGGSGLERTAGSRALPRGETDKGVGGEGSTAQAGSRVVSRVTYGSRT